MHMLFSCKDVVHLSYFTKHRKDFCCNFQKFTGHRAVRCRTGISSENAALRLTRSIFNSINQKIHV
jgi:hypothetical protein